MTIEMARFDSLQRGAGKDQVLVLADSRVNWIDGQARRGLLLHHPHLVQLRTQQPASAPEQLLFQLDNDRCEILDRLRAAKLTEERRLKDLPWEQQLARENQPRGESLDDSYRDPVGPPFDGAWVAAFAPVIIKGRQAPVKDTALIVIVQERRE